MDLGVVEAAQEAQGELDRLYRENDASESLYRRCDVRHLRAPPGGGGGGATGGRGGGPLAGDADTGGGGGGGGALGAEGAERPGIVGGFARLVGLANDERHDEIEIKR